MTAPVSAAELLEGTQTIGLDELNAAAGLLTRVDRKYLLSASELAAVVAALPEGSRVLQIEGALSSAYSSTYFDTPGWDSYLGAARRRRRRAKIRTRSYVDADVAFLEVKTRGSRSLTVKERIPYRTDDADRITGAGAAYIADALTQARIDGIEVADLAPVLRTGYRRSTVLLPDGGRATIDVELSWERVHGEGLDGDRMLVPDAVIVETKSPSSPSVLDRILWSRGVRPSSMSKYATGVAMLEPGMPSNKWSRLLRQGLSGAVSEPRRSQHDRNARPAGCEHGEQRRTPVRRRTPSAGTGPDASGRRGNAVADPATATRTATSRTDTEETR
ncbi:polyphosphate polymerase domain-containing protein [Mycetocola reblochoni]|uniref:VTC domain-containing protein n=2 Tax=Mycetocola reblochoni TaxID=331618 RepID=A0A1R4JHR0_9MICO|nr:polyphosphate polymerase domain-containing protein [Mycetocola reblochoni]SJN31771.1 hypothetical protein FM119_07690 [Mycetocola reblochoni REB411]